MSELEKLIEQQINDGGLPALDSIMERVLSEGSNDEREVLADAYISYFGTCHYDYMCGKYNHFEWIQELEDIPDRIKQLWPEFEDYFYFRAHVFEMFSTVSEQKEDKINYVKKCLELLHKQREVNDNDVRLLLDIAENILTLCELTKNYSPELIDEAKSWYKQAIHLEQKTENQDRFFVFNGTAIHAFLNASYQFLFLPIENSENFYQEYVASFKETITLYAKDDAMIYYHWVDTLVGLAKRDGPDSQKGLSESIKTEIWNEVKQILPFITNLKSENEFFLTSIGHLFYNIANHEEDLSYYEVSYNYYYQALKINDKTWTNPTYVCQALKMIAYMHLKKGGFEKAKDFYLQGFEVFNQAQQKVDDFQLSLNHGEHLFEYAKVIEQFFNKETLKQAQKQFEHSISLANDFYTQPYYGLAKTFLKLGDKEECLKVLEKCGNVFTEEYHTHDFKEIIDDDDFEEIHEFIPELINKLKKGS
jgi:tetratricopeptide (TPR) repeat protein